LKSRPQEVVDWSRQRALVPSITDAQKFHEKWITWWGGCQPKWRSVEAWPFSRDDAKGKDWDRLNITGPHGLFAVVMSTSWWAASANLVSHRAAFDAAVTDLHWVIENLVDWNSPSQVTELQPNTGPATHFPGHGERGPGKRKIIPSLKASGKP
jgi:hypothetical protein